MSAFKYVGPGHHYGVPKRDITEEEFAALSPRLQRIVTESPAYKAKSSNTKQAASDDTATTKKGGA